MVSPFLFTLLLITDWVRGALSSGGSLLADLWTSFCSASYLIAPDWKERSWQKMPLIAASLHAVKLQGEGHTCRCCNPEPIRGYLPAVLQVSVCSLSSNEAGDKDELLWTVGGKNTATWGEAQMYELMMMSAPFSRGGTNPSVSRWF